MSARLYRSTVKHSPPKLIGETNLLDKRLTRDAGINTDDIVALIWLTT